MLLANGVICLLGSLASVWEFVRTQPLAAALWAGLGVLTLALLILMRTRWGQAKPISKCVVLSIFAHVLFFGYAYGTRMILGPAQVVKDEVIQLHVVEPSPQQPPEEDEANKKQELQPWDRMAGSPPTGLMSLPAERPSFTSPPLRRDLVVSQRPGSPDAKATDLAVETAVPDATAERRTLENVIPAAEHLQAAKMATPKPRSTRKATPLVGPTGSALARREPAAAPPLPSPAETLRPDKEAADRQARIQRQAIEAAKSKVARMAVDDDLPGRGTKPDKNRPAQAVGPSGHDPSGDSTPLARRQSDGSEDSGPNGASASVATAAPIPRRLGDGQPLPDVMRWRAANDRQKIVREMGGDRQTEAAVELALQWLARHQSVDGNWDADALGGGRAMHGQGQHRDRAGAQADSGITGLVLLAFMGAGNTHLEGPYRQQVERGLNYLLRSQTQDGFLAGRAKFFARMYCHGMATLAISESYSMTGDRRLRDPLKKAVDYTIRSQHPQLGGWRYHPGDQGDMSQFGWQVMALRSAKTSGLAIPAETHAGMLRFLASVSSGQHQGLASYRPNEQVSRTMTAEALACRCFLGLTDQTETIDEATEFLMGELPGQGQVNYYYWYYGTLALQQLQGDAWKRWNTAMKSELLRRQRRQGSLAGSWEPKSAWGAHGGRAYTTAMAALCLESYYRYLPLTNEQSRPAMARRPGESSGATLRFRPTGRNARINLRQPRRR